MDRHLAEEGGKGPAARSGEGTDGRPARRGLHFGASRGHGDLGLGLRVRLRGVRVGRRNKVTLERVFIEGPERGPSAPGRRAARQKNGAVSLGDGQFRRLPRYVKDLIRILLALSLQRLIESWCSALWCPTSWSGLRRLPGLRDRRRRNRRAEILGAFQ